MTVRGGALVTDAAADFTVWGGVVIRVLVETLLLVFVDPVREGRPRPRTWPRGLPPVGLLILAAYAAVTVLIIAAPLLRQVDPMVPVGDGLFLGAWSITVLYWVTTLVLATAVTGLLHVHPAVRWPALALITLMLVMFIQSASGTTATLAGLVSVIGLWVFALLRLGRAYAPMEFAVVLVFTSVAVMGVGWGRSDLGVDVRGPSLVVVLSTLYVLAMPALTMAGFAFAEVAVDLAEHASDRLAAHAGSGGCAGCRWLPCCWWGPRRCGACSPRNGSGVRGPGSTPQRCWAWWQRSREWCSGSPSPRPSLGSAPSMP